MLLVLAVLSLGGKPKKEKEPPPPPGPAMPADLNEASLRVVAVDTIYQLDLSPAQLHAIQSAAAGCASTAARTPAKANPKLKNVLDELNRALLDGKDDQQIARLRNQMVELATGEDAHLDDEIKPTPAALAKAPAVSRQFTASQIAAFLASHADDVGDPVEKMLWALPALHDAAPAEVEAQTQDVADDVARLIVGTDDTKTATVAGKISGWLKANRELTDEDVSSRRAALEESAKKIVGDLVPMDVLSHWMDNQTAVLLSNPQLPDAITAVLAAKEKG